jgi:hypothetical protein
MPKIKNHFEFHEGPCILIESGSAYHYIWLQEIIYLKITKKTREICLYDGRILKIDKNSAAYSLMIEMQDFYPVSPYIFVNLSTIMACLKTGEIIMKGGKSIKFPISNYNEIVSVWSKSSGMGIDEGMPIDMHTRQQICEMIMQTRALVC